MGPMGRTPIVLLLHGKRRPILLGREWDWDWDWDGTHEKVGHFAPQSRILFNVLRMSLTL